MLIRTARQNLQKDRRSNLQPLLGQLQLPWLCPALLENHGRRRVRSSMVDQKSITTTASSSSKPQLLATSHRRSQNRNFAYATTIEHERSQDPFVPFDIPGHPATSGDPSLAWLRDDDKTPFTFDPLSPLVIRDSLTRAPRKFRAVKGIGGDLDEIQRILHACLQLGQLDRAAATLRRLNEIYKPDTPELTRLHSEYIAALVERIIRTKDQDLLKHVQKWFEVDLRGKGIKPDAITFAHMIQAAFQELKQPKIDRTIRRYIDIAYNCGIGAEAMGVTLSLLNEQQIGRVTRSAPMTFHEASEDTFSEQDALPFTTSPLPLAIDESDNATSEVAPVPQVHPVPQVPPARIKEHTQKGVGLKSLQNALSIFSENPSLPLPELEKPQESKENDYSFQRQSRLEQDVLSSALDRWRAEQDKSVQRNGAEGNLSSLGSLMWQWHEVLTRLINQEVIKIKESELKGNRLDPDGENPLIGPYLQYINPVKISAVTILTVIGSMSRFGVDRPSKIANLATKVGRAIEVESLAELFKNTPPFNERGKQRAQKKVGACERQYKLASLIKKAQSHESVVKAMNAAELSSFSRRDLQWSSTTKVKIGALLISFLLKAAKMDVKRKNPETGETTVGKQPAFWNSHHFQLGKRIGVLRMNPVLTARLAKEPVACALARHLPMVVEPRPWTSHREGAFLSVSSPVVRMRSGHDQVYKYIRAAAEGGDLVQLFAGLNVLGKTPWKINRPVFDVMSKVWNSGEALVDFPPEDPKIEYPPEPDLPKDHIDHRRWVYQVKGLNNIRCGLHSQRCHLNFILEIARAYLNETMYFPHNVDFRGRAYPMSPYLNHMGADYCRGLLLFADGKELGPRGLTWLKVHLANVAGYDKASLEERRAFTENHLSDIYDSAMKPLDGDRWWLQAEDPWQCLAACMELKNALDSPDPTKFVSFLAVHQDGTCNGLQHYAALGGDTIGAKQVNLEPGDRPSDVYTAVANHVNREIVVEAAQGDKKALFLEGKVTRKIVKTTVMTNVYGVTFIGAKLQVQKNLVDAYPDFPNTSDINLSNCAIYITHKVFKALSSMFNGARDIQNWLGECASRICASLSPDQMDWIEENAITEGNEPQFAIRPSNDRSHKDEQTRFKTSVIWTTPLKMPVVQPYRQAVDQNVMTNLQKMTIMDPSAADSVVRRKQLQAFAPNFIHSLDATHMLLSALKSDEEGLTFAAVHDSFWTHAADIDKMNIILRDAFIRMHSEDIIGRLATEFSTRHKDYMYLASIRAKSVLGRKLIQFRKQRRKDAIGKPRNKAKNPGKPSSLLGELLVEKRRLRLLASEDPAARAEGESMMTPSRIAETADEEDFQVDEYETAIGTMSTTADDAFANDVTSVEDDDDIGSLESNDTSVNRNNIGSLDDLTGIDTIVQAPTAGQDFEQIDKLKVEEMKRQAKRGEAAAKEMLLKAKNAYYRKIRVWMPLTFPPVPKKGDFNIATLRNSSYFFS